MLVQSSLLHDRACSAVLVSPFAERPPLTLPCRVQGQGTSVDARHYSVLVDAFARAGDRKRAMRCYAQALQRWSGPQLSLFTAAVHACAAPGAAADIDLALSVFEDLQRCVAGAV